MGYAMYPNLELLEYKVNQMVKVAHKEEIEKFLQESKYRRWYPKWNTVMFKQVWGSTCGGNDATANGDAVFAGCAMTEQYTTVFADDDLDVAVVCFGNEPSYSVSPISDNFRTDLKNGQIVSRSMAPDRY